MGLHYNIFAMAGASDLKFGMQLEIAKARHKITQKKGWEWRPWPWAVGANVLYSCRANDSKEIMFT